MHKGADWIAATGFFGVFASWIAFAVVFTFRKKPPKAAEAKRDPKSYWGMGLEGIGYWSVWIFPRRYFSPIVPMTEEPAGQLPKHSPSPALVQQLDGLVVILGLLAPDLGQKLLQICHSGRTTRNPSIEIPRWNLNFRVADKLPSPQ